MACIAVHNYSILCYIRDTTFLPLFYKTVIYSGQEEKFLSSQICYATLFIFMSLVLSNRMTKQNGDTQNQRLVVASSMRRFLPRRLFSVLCLSMLLLAAGIALFAQIGNIEGSHANFTLPAGDPASVVEAPTLPAATVDAIFASVGSPMVGTGKVVEQVARQANIDDAFALGVWWVETNDGAAGVGSADRNPGSVRASSGYPVAFDGYTIYPSYSAAIFDWFNILNNRYISRGLTTVYAISHPYVGTSSSSLWAGKVMSFMQRYRGEAPPPTPTPLPRPVHPAISQHWPQSSKLSDQGQEAARLATIFPARTQRLSAVPGSTSQPALAPLTRDAIVLLGLLTALALALYSLALEGKLSLPAYTRVRQPANPAVITEALHFAISPSSGLPALHQTGEMPASLPATEAPLPVLPATTGPRRITLRPAPAAEPHTTSLLAQASSSSTSIETADSVLVPVPDSAMGLLSRYRKMQQGEDVSL